ncbi:MAG: hypothetical protein IJ214_07395, partial [Clostridia bacterium]|nr:hypothetical protein [Clostridia bacterium]
MERSVTKLLSRAEKLGGIAAAMREWQLRHDDTVSSAAEMDARMLNALAVMRDSAEKGLDPALRSVSRLTGGNAARLMEAALAGRNAGGSLLGRVCARALAV